MLPRAERLRRRRDFAETSRRGRRARSGTLVLALLARDPARPNAAQLRTAQLDTAEPGPARTGFVVGRAVGPAVVRNRVKRRLRALVSARRDRLPAGARLVVRALPPAARADSARLGADLDAVLERVLRA